jgi:hypothetical protein
MTTIVTRAGKGSPLTNAEVDANFTNLNTDKIEVADVRTLTNKTIDSITNTVGADHIHFKIKATEAVAKGDVLKVTGYNSGEDAIEVAKVSSAADIAVGLAHDTLTSGSFGALINTGLLEGIDTSAFAVGDVLYPNTSGGLTTTKPASGTYQAIALVLRAHAVNGTVLIEATEPNTIWLPSQTGNSGKFLTTNGTTASWATVDLTPYLAKSGGTMTGAITFAAGQTWPTFNQNTTGNAATATTLQTARTINGVSFDGSANITVADSTKLPLAGGTMTGAITFAGGQTWPTFNQNTTGSAATFTSTAQNSQFNSVGVGTAGSGTAGEIRATNNITAYYSDARLKTKIGDIESPLAKVRQIETMLYHANETAVALGYDASIVEVGVSAQSVQKVQPEAVAPAPIDDKYLTVRYERLVPLLIEAIKELDATVAKLVD